MDEERAAATALLNWIDQRLIEFEQFESFLHEPDYPDADAVRAFASQITNERDRLQRLRRDVVSFVGRIGMPT
jgi:hypothetical protein